MSGIRPVQRYFHWRGRQRPLIGLVLPDADPLRRAASPDAVRAEREAGLRRAHELGLDLVALTVPAGDPTPDYGWLPEAAARHGLAVALHVAGVPPPARMFWQPDAALRAGGVLACVDPGAPLDDDVIEDVLVPLCRRHDLPLAVAERDPLSAAGKELRRAARTADATCVVLHEDRCPEEALSLVATCLSARLSDRPCLALYRGTDPGRATAVGRAALASGLAAFLCGIEPVAAELASFTMSLPNELTEPRLEPAAVLVLDPSEGTRAPIEAVLGSLRLLQRGACASARLLFQDRPDEPAPELVFVPAHGPLSPAAWMLCQALAGNGAHVLITGLVVEGDATRAQLARLQVEPATVAAGRRYEFPAWLRDRPVLDTAGRVLSRRFPDTGGQVELLDRPIELDPRAEWSLATIGRVASQAGVEPESWLREGDLGAFRRTVVCGDRALRADLTAGTLGCA